MDTKDIIFNFIKKYNITAIELEDDNISRTQISRMKNGQIKMKEKHYSFYINSINRVLKERGFLFNFESGILIQQKELEDFLEQLTIEKNLIIDGKIEELKKMLSEILKML